MRKTLQAILRCPLCAADIQINDVFEETSEDLIHGSMYCECDTYPVCHGILMVRNSPVKKYVLHFLKEGAFQQAAMIAMANYTDDLCRILDYAESHKAGKPIRMGALTAVTAYLNMRYGKYFKDRATFTAILGDGAYDQYLRHRFSSETLWSLYPFLPSIRNKGGRVLEICCGAGHASFILSKSSSPERMIGIDGNFRNLFLATKFLSQADFIQADVNAGLPFRDHQFSTAFMIDSFHYVEARALLAREIARVTTHDGFNLILHLHNSGKKNMSAGHPMSPTAIERIFPDGPPIRLLPERAVVERFLQNGRLDLSEPYDGNRLRETDAFIVTRGLPAGISETHWDAPLHSDDQLIVNPLYRIADQDDHILLTRCFPSDAYRREYPLTEAHLPERYGIKKAVLTRGGYPLSESLGEMRRRFVLLTVPRHYGGKSPFDLV